MIEADDADGADAFAAELLGPERPTGEGRRDRASAIGAGAWRPGRSTTASWLLGERGRRRAMLEAGRGQLAGRRADGDGRPRRAARRSPRLRLSLGRRRPGAARRSRGLSPFDTFVDPARDDGRRRGARRADDGLSARRRAATSTPSGREASPGFFAALPPFEPELPADVGSDALAYLGLGDPGDQRRRAARAGGGRRPRPAGRGLRRASSGTSSSGPGVDVGERSAAAARLGGRALAAAGQRRGRGRSRRGRSRPRASPYVSLIADGVDAEARGAVARRAAGAGRQGPRRRAGRARSPAFETIADRRGARRRACSSAPTSTSPTRSTTTGS